LSSNGDLTGVDLLLDIAGVLAVNSAADGHAGAEDFLDGTLEASGVALGAHLLGDLEDLVELDLAVVDNVLGLLAITWGFLEGLEHERSGGGEHGDKALSVLDHDLDVDLDSLPGKSGLLDIFTDLLGGETDGTALGGKGSSSGDLATDDFHINVLLFVRIHRRFRRHVCVFLPIN
jgi:hypothetical protein